MRNSENSAGPNREPDSEHASRQSKQTRISNHAPTRSRLPKREIIRKQETFREILETGKRWHEKHMTIVYLSFSERRIGFAVSKRLGNAVVRNRMKRRMREIYRHHRDEIGDVEMIILARNGLDRARYGDLEEEFERFIQRKSGGAT